MSVSLRDFIKAVYGLYLVTAFIVFGDMILNRFTVRSLDLVKLVFFIVLTVAIALFIWFVKE